MSGLSIPETQGVDKGVETADWRVRATKGQGAGVEEYEVFPAMGEAGFRQLIHAFYAQIPGDDILGPMYAGRDLAAAEKRLCDFLIYRFGGPDSYIEERGHPRLRMRHAPFVITQAARDRWMQLMTKAFAEVPLPEEPASILKGFFDDTATFMINRA